MLVRGDSLAAKMSHYLEDSELSRFNQSVGTTPFPVSRETFEVFRDANKYHVRDAVEQIYGVKVKDVRTMVVPGKLQGLFDVGKSGEVVP